MDDRQHRLWKCPRCHRKFRNRNPWHSCEAASVSGCSQGKDAAVRKLHSSLLRRVKKIGRQQIDAVKTSIHFASKYHFCGVTVRKNHLLLGFISEAPIEDGVIVKAERLGPRRMANRARFRHPHDLSPKVVKWLREAYRLKS